jgi:hypothetical protein
LRIVDHGHALKQVMQMFDEVVNVLHAAGEDTLATHATDERDRVVKERKASPLAFEK